jgi:hypothetical protein
LWSLDRDFYACLTVILRCCLPHHEPLGLQRHRADSEAFKPDEDKRLLFGGVKNQLCFHTNLSLKEIKFLEEESNFPEFLQHLGNFSRYACFVGKVLICQYTGNSAYHAVIFRFSSISIIPLNVLKSREGHLSVELEISSRVTCTGVSRDDLWWKMR